jgi:hypothetical protein
MMPIMRKVIPKLFVSSSLFSDIFWLTSFRAVVSRVLNKITGKAWPKPNMKSKRPPWKGVGAVNIVSSMAGKTIASEHGPKAMEITNPKRKELMT